MMTAITAANITRRRQRGGGLSIGPRFSRLPQRSTFEVEEIDQVARPQLGRLRAQRPARRLVEVDGFLEERARVEFETPVAAFARGRDGALQQRSADAAPSQPRVDEEFR